MQKTLFIFSLFTFMSSYCPKEDGTYKGEKNFYTKGIWHSEAEFAIYWHDVAYAQKLIAEGEKIRPEFAESLQDLIRANNVAQAIKQECPPLE